MILPIQYFKILKGLDNYQYYKVHGVPGKIRNGYQEVIRFKDLSPSIHVEYNYIHDPKGIEGTWVTFEEGELISELEYKTAMSLALSDLNFSFR